MRVENWDWCLKITVEDKHGKTVWWDEKGILKLEMVESEKRVEHWWIREHEDEVKRVRLVVKEFLT